MPAALTFPGPVFDTQFRLNQPEGQINTLFISLGLQMLFLILNVSEGIIPIELQLQMETALSGAVMMIRLLHFFFLPLWVSREIQISFSCFLDGFGYCHLMFLESF